MTTQTQDARVQEGEKIQAYLIMGTFWESNEDPPDPRRMTAFSGEVNLNLETRTFKGIMSDEYGVSEVEGGISETGRVLQFKKTYTACHPNGPGHAKGTLTYLLERRFEHGGAWFGPYFYDREANPGGFESDYTGFAFAGLYPL